MLRMIWENFLFNCIFVINFKRFLVYGIIIILMFLLWSIILVVLVIVSY